MNQPSKLSTLLKFVETENPSHVLLEIESKNAPGDNFVGLQIIMTEFRKDMPKQQRLWLI
jgi:hypothetical protein